MKTILCILFLAIISNQLHAQTALTPEILWKFKRITGGTVSPNGKYLLYSLRSFSVAENSGNTDLFVINLSTKTTIQLTQTPGSEMEAQWSHDNFVWFMTNEKNGAQLWKIDPANNMKSQCSLFENKEIEGFKLSPTGREVICVEAIKMKSDIHDRHPDLPLANARLEDDLMYRHWDHYDDYAKRHLFLYPIGTSAQGTQVASAGIDILKGEAYDGILPPHGGLENITFSNDGSQVIYASKKMQGKDFAQSTNSALYCYSSFSKTTQQLTEKYLGYDTYPRFASNGNLAWLSMARNGFESDKNDIIVRDLQGNDRNLTKNIDLSITDFEWHPSGKTIYFLAAIKGTVQLFELDITSGKHRQITSSQHDYLSLSVAASTVYAGRQSMVEPTDLYAITIKGSAVEQLTAVNKEILAGIKMPKVEPKWVTTSDNKKMLVWMVLPPDFDTAKKYPALLYCQGGPQSPVSQFFSYRWNLALMASNGYVVVAPNRRGLPGFGQEWNDAISKDWGGQAMRDYLTAIDSAAILPYVDKERLGAVGASYGGYSVYMLAGIHNNRFKTFVSHCGLFNLESWYGTTEELFFANWDQGGPYWNPANAENYAKNSPHKYVQNWNTPMLVIHGGLDFRVPESEGIQAFQAAQLKGLKSKYLSFPAEGHWITRPQNSIVWQREFFKWLDEDLKP
jgi:dipeptidyl aminopeptidase/acylaminoacyl peptidase